MNSPENVNNQTPSFARLSFSVYNSDVFLGEIGKMRRKDSPDTPMRILSSKGRMLQRRLIPLGQYDQSFKDVDEALALELSQPFDLRSVAFGHAPDGETSRLALQPSDQERLGRVTSLLDGIEPGKNVSDSSNQYVYIDFATESLIGSVKSPNKNLRNANPLKTIKWLVGRRIEEERSNPIRLRLNPNVVIGSGLQYKPHSNRIAR